MTFFSSYQHCLGGEGCKNKSNRENNLKIKKHNANLLVFQVLLAMVVGFPKVYFILILNVKCTHCVGNSELQSQRDF